MKPMMLPIAMLIGAVAHDYIGYVAFLSKPLIFVMLLITYSRLKPSDFRIGNYIWCLLAVQVVGALCVYALLAPFDPVVSQGVFICVFCPTATAAPVITGMLGGSVTRVATYSLFSNVAVALLAPLMLPEICPEAHISFGEAMTMIASGVLPLILGPLFVALLMRRYAPRLHRTIATRQSLSFYIWAFALIIVVGNAVSFMVSEPLSAVPEMLLLAGGALAVCVAQFAVGRRIGGHFGDMVSGAQSLGQKNTVLAIWIALNYMSPLASVAPAAYVAWHNIVNSWQIYRSNRDFGAPKQDSQP